MAEPDDSMEVWKAIPLPNLNYEVSSHGRIRGVRSKQIVKLVLTKKGRVLVGCYDKARGKQCRFQVHRLVGFAFNGFPPPDKPETNHKNGKPADNRPSNLEWCTRSENERHAYRLGLKTSPALKCGPKISKGQYRRYKERPESFKHGEGHYAAKLTIEHVKIIRALGYSEPASVIANSFGVHKSTIKAIRSKRHWRRD